MGARELSDLLDRASADVPPPSFAEAAWSRASHVRRRRRSAGAVAAVVTALVVTGGALHSLRPAPQTGGPSTLPTAVPGAPTVDRIPAAPGTRAVRQLPAAGVTPPRDARPLSARPVRRAVAVYQPYSVDGDTRPQPLYVLDTDGTWARVDPVDLAFTRDADGNLADPLRASAISPDRRHVAVAQPDSLIVVDVTGGAPVSVPLPGFNEQVVWLSDGVVVVTRDRPDGPGTLTSAVDWRSGKVAPVDGPSAWNLVTPARPGGPVLELRAEPAVGPSAVGSSDVVEWDVAGGQVRRTPVDSTALRSYTMTEWFGPGFGNDGDLVVRAGFGTTPTGGAVDVVAVVDVRTGVVRRLLEPGRDRPKGCCQPLAWVDPVTVLLRTDREGLITWNVRTGEVSTVAAGAIGGTLAIGL